MTPEDVWSRLNHVKQELEQKIDAIDGLVKSLRKEVGEINNQIDDLQTDVKRLSEGEEI